MKKKRQYNSFQQLSGLISKETMKVDKEDGNAIEAPNLGWLFFKEYYKGINNDIIDPKNEKSQEKFFKSKNDQILNAKFGDYKNLFAPVLNFPTPEKENFKTITFDLKTTYPGLIMGTGVTHETGLKGEMKLGLSFDYTTGLPYIPGSSIKGILRSVFPGSFTKADKEFKEARTTYIRGILDNQEINVEELEAEIFEGTGCGSIYGRDIFMDALITGVSDEGIFLGSDYITPHGNPLKNPTPIMFLKVLPDVSITFHFRLKKGIVDAVQKMKLFRSILLDIGIGAMTNVGYGQLVSLK